MTKETIKFSKDSEFAYFKVYLPSYQRYAYWAVIRPDLQRSLSPSSVEFSPIYGWIGNWAYLTGFDQLSNDLSLNPTFLTRDQLVLEMGERKVLEAQLRLMGIWTKYLFHKKEKIKFGRWLPLVKKIRKIELRINLIFSLIKFRYDIGKRVDFISQIMETSKLSNKKIEKKYRRLIYDYNISNKKVA